ncbi:sugar transferase [Glutamicibacter sp. AOP3-A1-12]|uniref:sugar transferase n=1 Tax=Glutamicibacter sp. AOP3-A1-12 TaxID=3457701 RepID=UPI0040336575
MLASIDVLVSGAWMLAAAVVLNIGIDSQYVGYLVSTLCIWQLALYLKGSRRTDTLGVGSEEYKRVLSASLFTAGIVSIASMAGSLEVGRELVLAGILPGTLMLLFSRWMMRRVLHMRAKQGATLHRVIVVGEATDLTYLARQISAKSAGMYQIVGLIEDTNTPVAVDDVPVSYSLDDLDYMIKIHGADSVMVAGTLNDGPEAVKNLGWRLEKTKTELILASNLTNVAGPRIHMRPVEGLPLMHVEPPAFDGARMWAKRILDMVLSVSALLVLIPVLALIALAIRIDSAGPVLFAQRRVGKDGQEFTMLKFRTMVVDAEAQLKDLKGSNEGAGPLFKLKNDPRVTRIGKVLRKLSLDELPQIVNVMRGDMSLVGPRPPLRTEVDCYEQHTFRRLLIKPGLTGLWQVNGRSDLSWDDSVRLDLYYVENWSVVGDLIIMWHTFKAMVRPQGAY